jgi:hypothetical protein
VYRFEWKFQKSLYAYYIHICSMKSPLASTIASIRGWNTLQGQMTTSLSMPAITSEILALMEAGVLWGYLLTSPSTSLHMKESKRLQSFELGGNISFDQWFFRFAFSQPGWFWLCGRVKLLAQLQKFRTLPTCFVAKWWWVYITSYKRCTAFQWDLQNIYMISRCLSTLIQKLS